MNTTKGKRSWSPDKVGDKFYGLSVEDRLEILKKAYSLYVGKLEAGIYSSICKNIQISMDMFMDMDIHCYHVTKVIPELGWFKPKGKDMTACWFNPMETDERLKVMALLIDIYYDMAYHDGINCRIRLFLLKIIIRMGFWKNLKTNNDVYKL